MAPKAVRVEVLPAQIAVGLAKPVTVGVGTTANVKVVKLVQPKGLVPLML